MKQNSRQDKNLSRHLGKGKVTKGITELSKKTRQWKQEVQIHNKQCRPFFSVHEIVMVYFAMQRTEHSCEFLAITSPP